MISGRFQDIGGRRSKYMTLTFLTFSAILQLNGRLVMIPDAAVSNFDKCCQSKKVGGGINCRGGGG